MTDQTKLLPCPFCGAHSVDLGSSEHLDPEDGGGKFAVLCDKCGASTSLYCNTKAEAIAAWNTRAPNPEQPK